jgi:hypothetical protein
MEEVKFHDFSEQLIVNRVGLPILHVNLYDLKAVWKLDE